MAQSLIPAAPVLPALPFQAARVDENGITAPSFSDMLEAIQSAYSAIFGADVYIDPDSQDGQLLAIFVKAMSDGNDAAIACYNSYSPSTAVGAGLSSVVKINGIKRKIPSSSSAIVRLRGVAGTEIGNGVVRDILGNNWSLPASVIIPNTGEIQVTAVCQTLGAVVADLATINQIVTPIPGWQTVSNDMAAAVPGAPVESDAQLRRRQTFSTAIPSLSVLDGIVGAVWEVPGTVRVKGYENPLDFTDPVTHQPPHSIAIVSQGGDVGAICQTIALKKTPGSQTTGDVAQMVVDPYGIPNVVRYWQLVLVPLTVIITVTPLPGYNSGTSTMIRAAVIEFVNRLDIGETSYHNRLFAPANLAGDAATDITGQTQQQLDAISETYNIAKIEQGVMQPYFGFDVESANIDGFDVGSWTPKVVMVEADLPINFREAFTSDGTRVGVIIAPIPGRR
jgi:uncharacterized phage protein gp47/JayE